MAEAGQDCGATGRGGFMLRRRPEHAFAATARFGALGRRGRPSRIRQCLRGPRTCSAAMRRRRALPARGRPASRCTGRGPRRSTAGMAVRQSNCARPPGFAAIPVICTAASCWPCRKVRTVLAVAVSAAELRRLRIAHPAGGTRVAPSAEPQQAAAGEPFTPAPAKPAAVRFLWQSDGEGRLTTVSRRYRAACRPRCCRRAVGRPALAESDQFDHPGSRRRPGRALCLPTTMERLHALLWRTDSADEGVKVELSGVPVLDAQRKVSPASAASGLARPDRARGLSLLLPLLAAEPEDEPPASEDVSAETAAMPVLAEASVDAPVSQAEMEAPGPRKLPRPSAQDETCARCPDLPGEKRPGSRSPNKTNTSRPGSSRSRRRARPRPSSACERATTLCRCVARPAGPRRVLRPVTRAVEAEISAQPSAARFTRDRQGALVARLAT